MEGKSLQSDMSLDDLVSQLIQDSLAQKTDGNNIEKEAPTTKTEMDTNNIIESLQLDVTIENCEKLQLNSEGSQLNRKMYDNIEYIDLPRQEHIEVETLTIKIEEDETLTIATEEDTNHVTEDLQLEVTMENSVETQLSSEVSQLKCGDSQLKIGVSQPKKKKHNLPQKIPITRCVHCGRSVNRTRYHHLLQNNSEREVKIFNVICNWTVGEVTPTSKICHPCWLRADRESKRRSPQGDNHQAVSSVDKENKSEPFIILPNCHRAINTETKCFVSGCKRRERHRVPVNLRKMLFIKYNYYVPPNNRICKEHLTCFSWEFITSTIDDSSHQFTAAYVEDFAQLLKNDDLVDFNDVRNMDDHLVYYWFGISKQEFLDLVAKVPALNEMYKGEFALAVYLLKLRTGDSNEKLAILTKTARSTLEGLMKKAREAVPLDLLPLQLRRKVAKTPTKLSDGKGKVQPSASSSSQPKEIHCPVSLHLD